MELLEEIKENYKENNTPLRNIENEPTSRHKQLKTEILKGKKLKSISNSSEPPISQNGPSPIGETQSLSNENNYSKVHVLKEEVQKKIKKKFGKEIKNKDPLQILHRIKKN